MDRSCNKCSAIIPYKIKINGKWRNLKNRKFCLLCSPFGNHNTRDITKPKIGKSKSNGRSVTKYRRKLKWKLVKYKGGKCQKCGYNKEVAGAYDFHHRNPCEKEFGIASNLGKSWKTLVFEVDKCDLLCKNCHAEVHNNIESSMNGEIASFNCQC